MSHRGVVSLIATPRSFTLMTMIVNKRQIALP